MMTKVMNYLEIINEAFIFISVYFMMIFTNWMDNIELRYYLGFSLLTYIFSIVCFNMIIIVIFLVTALYWKYKEYKYNKAWKIHNEKKEK